jgi:hypothetical protein
MQYFNYVKYFNSLLNSIVEARDSLHTLSDGAHASRRPSAPRERTQSLAGAQSLSQSTTQIPGRREVMMMYDIGNTDPRILYDFAVTLEATTWTCLDPDSELYRAVKAVYDSVWGQLPPVIAIDFLDPDTQPTPRPPLVLHWDEIRQRYT